MSFKKRTLSLFLSIVMVLGLFPNTATAAEADDLPLNDVSAEDWSYDGIKYCYDNKLMDEISDDTFGPGITTTRAMLVTALHRLEGSPSVFTTGTFTDVSADAPYAVPVEWASANGVVNGYGNGLFGPNNLVTREQMAAILYRYVTYKNYDVSRQNNISAINEQI